MAKVIVQAHTTTQIDTVNIKEGDIFDVVTEPRDLHTSMLLMHFQDDPDAVIVDLGVGYMVFSILPDEEGRSLLNWFDMKEVA